MPCNDSDEVSKQRDYEVETKKYLFMTDLVYCSRHTIKPIQIYYFALICLAFAEC